MWNKTTILLQYSLRFRELILCLLIVVLFVNWYHYQPLYDELKDIHNYPFVLEHIVPILGYKTTNFILVKGLVFFGFVLINVGISLSILFYFFRGDKTILLRAVYILGGYAICMLILEALFFIFDYDFLFWTTRKAMNILPSPLVEASLIPLLKLSQQQPSEHKRPY